MLIILRHIFNLSMVLWVLIGVACIGLLILLLPGISRLLDLLQKLAALICYLLGAYALYLHPPVNKKVNELFSQCRNSVEQVISESQEEKA